MSASQEASRAAAGTVALGALQTVGRVLALAFVAVATRVVVPASFGRYAIVAGLVGVAGFLADFGSTTVITRAVSRAPRDAEALLSQTIVASVAVGLLAYGAVVVYVAVGPYSHATVVDVAIGGLAIPFDAALTSVSGALDGHGLIARRAVASFVRVATLAGGGALAVAVTGSVRAAIAFVAIGPAAGLVVALVLARRHGVWSLRLRPCVRRSFELFRLAVPYALLGGIGALVARLDLLVLSALRPASAVARYDLALRGAEGAAALAAVVAAPALFLVSRRLARHDVDGSRAAYREAVRFAYVTGIPLAALLGALARPITDLVLGHEYHDVAPLLVLLSPWLALSVLGSAQGAVVLASEHPGRALRASLPVLMVAVVLDAALIPVLGAAGAALASVGAEVASCAVFNRLNRATLGMSTPRPSNTLVVGCVAVAVAGFAATEIGPLWVGIAALPVLPLVLWKVGVIRTGELRRLRRVVIDGSRA